MTMFNPTRTVTLTIEMVDIHAENNPQEPNPSRAVLKVMQRQLRNAHRYKKPVGSIAFSIRLLAKWAETHDRINARKKELTTPIEPITEDQFPLDNEQGELPNLPETFPVIVNWHDPIESPTQAIIRLNNEVMASVRKGK